MDELPAEFHEKIESIETETRRIVRARAIADRVRSWTDFEVQVENEKAIRSGEAPPQAVAEVEAEDFESGYLTTSPPEDLPELLEECVSIGPQGIDTVYRPVTKDNERQADAVASGNIEPEVRGRERLEATSEEANSARVIAARSPFEDTQKSDGVSLQGRTLRIPFDGLLPGQMDAPKQTLKSVLDDLSVATPLVAAEVDGELTLLDGHIRLRIIEELRYNFGVPVNFEIEERPAMSGDEALEKAVVLNTHRRIIGKPERREIIQRLADIHKWDDFSEHGLGAYLARVLCVSQPTISRDLRALQNDDHANAKSIRRLEAERGRLNTVRTAMRYLRDREVSLPIDEDFDEDEEAIIRRFLTSVFESVDSRREEIEAQLENLQTDEPRK